MKVIIHRGRTKQEVASEQNGFSILQYLSQAKFLMIYRYYCYFKIGSGKFVTARLIRNTETSNIIECDNTEVSFNYMTSLTTHTSLSPIWRGFVPGFVNYKKGCTRLAATSDKVLFYL
jgi:hypothetical protein